MYKLCLWAGAALSLAAPLAAQTPADIVQVIPPADPTPEQTAANETAKALGLRIYLHDQAAWHGTDALFAAIRIEDHPEVKGYVTQELDGGLIGLVYFAEIDGARYEFARYAVSGSVVVSGEVHARPAEHPLSDALNRQVDARQAALEQAVREKVTLCTDGSANIVTLPQDEDGLTSVYILSSPTVPGRFPIGGHYLFKVNAQNQVVAGRAFQQKCLDVPVINPFVTAPPEKFAMADVDDNQPTEIYHFVAHYMNLPLEIFAGNVIWTMDYRNQSMDR